jgi:hypothetical protein
MKKQGILNKAKGTARIKINGINQKMSTNYWNNIFKIGNKTVNKKFEFSKAMLTRGNLCLKQ